MLKTLPTEAPSPSSSSTLNATAPAQLPTFLKGILTYVRDLLVTRDGELLLLATQRLLFWTVAAAFVAIMGALTAIWVLIVIALFTFLGR